MPFRKILLPVDWSGTTEESIRYAAEVSAAHKAELWLLHVDNGPHESRLETGWPAGSLIVPAPGLPLARRAVLPGDPAAVIAAYADDIDADLILMPTRGRGMLGQLLFGSTTLDVLKRTRRPVWMVKKNSLPSEPEAPCRRVLCGVSLGARGRMVIRHAADLAAEWDAELLLVYVTPEISEAMLALYGVDESGEIELVPGAARKRIARMAADLDVQCEIDVLTGDPAKCLRDAAKQHRADMVVIGRSAGATAGNIVARSACPVITFAEPLRRAETPRRGNAHHLVRAAAFTRLEPAGHLIRRLPASAIGPQYVPGMKFGTIKLRIQAC